MASLPSLPEHVLRLISALTASASVAGAGWGRLPTAADRADLVAVLATLEARSRPPTKTEVAARLARLANHFRSERSASEWQMLFEDYLNDLEEFSAADIEQAVIDHRRAKPFFPKISELVELAAMHRTLREFGLKRVRKLLEVCP